MALSEAKKRANKKWNDAHPYDRIIFLVPQGRKGDIKSAADAAGESVSEYANKAVLQRMNRQSWTDETAEGV